MSGPKVLGQVAEEVIAENFGDVTTAYATNPTTFRAVVTINGSPAGVGDVVGIFGGSELRAKQTVIIDGELLT